MFSFFEGVGQREVSRVLHHRLPLSPPPLPLPTLSLQNLRATFAGAKRGGERGEKLHLEQRGAVSPPNVGILEHAQGLLLGESVGGRRFFNSYQV